MHNVQMQASGTLCPGQLPLIPHLLLPLPGEGLLRRRSAGCSRTPARRRFPLHAEDISLRAGNFHNSDS